MILYNCITSPSNEEEYIITKFDNDFNVEATYTTSLSECDCPAGTRDTCRHRTMLPIFLASEHVNDNWFYNYDTHGWHKITSQELLGIAEDLVEPEGPSALVATPSKDEPLRRRI